MAANNMPASLRRLLAAKPESLFSLVFSCQLTFINQSEKPVLYAAYCCFITGSSCLVRLLLLLLLPPSSLCFITFHPLPLISSVAFDFCLSPLKRRNKSLSCFHPIMGWGVGMMSADLAAATYDTCTCVSASSLAVNI